MKKKDTVITNYSYNNKGWLVLKSFHDSMLGEISTEMEYDGEDRVIEIRNEMRLMGRSDITTNYYTGMGLISKVVFKKNGNVTETYRYEYFFNAK